MTFPIHTPVEGRAVRSGIARVADLSTENLHQLIEAIYPQAGAGECEELDLSEAATLEEQLAQINRPSKEDPHVSHP